MSHSAKSWVAANYAQLQIQSVSLAMHVTGEDQDAGDLFGGDEPAGMTKRELYQQTKEAKTMERLNRRMQGVLTLPHPV